MTTNFTKPLGLRDADFHAEVVESELPVLLDFWASWCPPCKMVEPVLQDLSQKLNGLVKIAKINVDQNPASGSEYNISGVPTFIVFSKGKEVGRCVGAQSKQQLLNMIEKAGVKT